MKFNLTLTLIISLFIGILSCHSQDKDTIVIIKTDLGEIRVKLYNETPLHKANFIKLIQSGFYKDRIFHRVIKNFMIQGGDDKLPENIINTTNRGLYNYTIPAEINRKLIHKRGALAAARMGDNVNPEKESSSTQFYIVQGGKILMTAFSQIEQMINNSLFNSQAIRFFKEEETKNNTKDSLKRIENQKIAIQKAKNYIETNSFSYTEEVKNIYKTEGGTPHLDMNYTVFGEVISGMDVIDKIADVQTGNADRPINDIHFSIQITE